MSQPSPADQAAIHSFCVSQTRILHQQRKYEADRAKQSALKTEAMETCRKWMMEQKLSCVIVPLTTEEVYYLRLQTKGTTTSMSVEGIQRAVESVSAQDLATGYSELVAKYHKKKITTPIKITDVWLHVLGQYLRQEHHAESEALSFGTQGPRRKKTDPPLPVAPPAITSACKTWQDCKQKIHHLEENKTSMCEPEQTKIEQLYPQLKQCLQRTNPVDLSYPVVLTHGAQQREYVMRLKTSRQSGHVGIKAFESQIPTSLNQAFQQSGIRDIKDTVNPPVKQKIKEVLLAQFAQQITASVQVSESVELYEAKK